MSVKMMVGSEKAGNPGVTTVYNYFGHEFDRVLHAYDCPDRNKYGMGDGCVGHRCSYAGPLYLEETHVGLVLGIGERNGYNDSDFYATVWNPAKGCPETFEYASTRGWSYPNSAVVDATPEVRAAYEAYLAVKADEARKEREAVEANTPRMGKLVRVVRGRKVAVGTVGRIFWMGEAQKYSPSRWAKSTTKIGIALDDTKDARGRYANVAWTYAENVEVVAA